jgi:hypothetical protein
MVLDFLNLVDSLFGVFISASTNSSAFSFLFRFVFFFFSGFNPCDVVRISVVCEVALGSVGVEVAEYSLTSSASTFFLFFLSLFLEPILVLSSSLSLLGFSSY